MQPNTSESTSEQALILPTSIATKRDVLRMQQLLEQYLEELLRAEAASSATLPTVPAEIVQLCAINTIHTLNTQETEKLKKQCAQLLETSPLVHIALSTEPDEKALTRFVEWFRREIHPSCLLQISVQPSIAGGCVVRTGSLIYDFSFRHMLLVSQQKLTEALVA